MKNIAEPVRAFRVAPDASTTKNADAVLPLPDKPSIAVLPFENMSGDPEQEYFADGIAEDIITALSRFNWFFVIARNSSFSYKGSAVDVKRVAKELGVQYVLEGSVRKGGNRLRITAQLIDAITGRHVWAERYDRDMQDVFAVQDEITEAIAAAVAPQFVSAEAGRIERKRPENFDAWDCAIRGNWHLWHFGKEDLLVAIRLFRTAIGMDPNSGVALSGLGAALNTMALNNWVDDPLETRAEALQYAQSAIAADVHDAWGHAVLGFCSTLLRRNDDALRACHRALELNNNLAFAEGVLAMTYAHQGDHEKAVAHHERATRLSPRDPAGAWWDIARSWAAIITGDYDEAVQWAGRMTEALPSFAGGWRHLSVSLAHLGRIEEARAALQQLLRISPHDNIRLVRAFLPSGQPHLIDLFVDGLRKAGLPE